MKNLSMKNNPDSATKERAEKAAKILAEVPKEKTAFFVAIAGVYLDGLIAGRNLAADNK